jgi:hypothetical protein
MQENQWRRSSGDRATSRTGLVGLLGAWPDVQTRPDVRGGVEVNHLDVRFDRRGPGKDSAVAVGRREGAPADDPRDGVPAVGREQFRYRPDPALDYVWPVQRGADLLFPSLCAGVRAPAEENALPAVQQGWLERQVVLVGEA